MLVVSQFFLSVVANDEEIQHLHTLCDLLVRKFGGFAKLLAIVDFQPVDEPLLIAGCDNLLIYKLHQSAHSGHLGNSPYAKPIAEAIQWAKTGRAQGARLIQSLSTEKFNPNNMAWIVPSVFEPFETVPRGGMKPFAASAVGERNGLQPQSLLSDNSRPHILPVVLNGSTTLTPSGQPSNVPLGASAGSHTLSSRSLLTPREVPSLAANLSMGAALSSGGLLTPRGAPSWAASCNVPMRASPRSLALSSSPRGVPSLSTYDPTYDDMPPLLPLPLDTDMPHLIPIP